MSQKRPKTTDEVANLEELTTDEVVRESLVVEAMRKDREQQIA